VHIPNLYTLLICVFYPPLRYVFGLHGHFKHHFSRSVLPFNSLKMPALASLLLAGTDITTSSCALPLLCSTNQVWEELSTCACHYGGFMCVINAESVGKALAKRPCGWTESGELCVFRWQR